jgi:hypothetical protein
MQISSSLRSGAPGVVLGVVALSVLYSLSGGCGNEDPAGPGSSSPTGVLVSMSDCKGFDAVAPARHAGQDCLSWSYDGRGTLTLQHVNTAFNCCPDYDIKLAVRQHTLTLIEQEITGHCSCLCLFDLTFTITDLPPGLYRVEIEQEYLESGAPTHAYELNLEQAGTGTLCVERQQYPWDLL